MRARPVVTALAGIGVALAVLGGTTACSSTSGASDASASEVDLSGSPVSTADEVTALCDQMVAEALTIEAAEALAESSGYVTRVGTLDGQPQAVTTDFREDRFTFDVTDGVVVGCTLG